MAVVPWVEVEPLESIDGSLADLLANVDTYRGAWREFVAQVSEEEFMEARQRSLRRHAIETGIIERLYDVSWGITEALVAEGLTREAAAREEGELTEDALATITAQFDALQFLAEAARARRPLTVFFVKELHELITRHQSTYEARDVLGRTVQTPLNHGAWKTTPNHVLRSDGSELQYAPPERVQDQMDELVRLYADTSGEHPLVRAAWLHHRFIRIHPFEDGNGRVARALVLLVLLGEDYAPLVVDRERRDEYLVALDAANDGDLASLIRLFAQLEIVGLLSELQRPALQPAVGESPVEVARGYVERLREARDRTDESRAAAVRGIASELQRRLEFQLERLGSELGAAFAELDTGVYRTVVKAAPPEENARWWYAQLVRSAQAAGFFANLAEGTWWVRLKLVVLNHELRYVVAAQKVGHGETGVLAVTAFAEFVPPRDGQEEQRSVPPALFKSGSGDHVTLNQFDSVDERWQEVCELVERTLAASVAEFGRLLG